MKNSPKVAVLGNPNCGKTAIFNLLTGLNQKVSNYPGITVEKKNSKVDLKRGLSFNLEDYPGSYSIVSQSIDEKVLSDSIYDWIRQPELKPDAIIYVLDIIILYIIIFYLHGPQTGGKVGFVCFSALAFLWEVGFYPL